jgi:lysophospholipase L1-like esterase
MFALPRVTLGLAFLASVSSALAVDIDVNATTHIVTLFKTQGETLLRYTLDGRDPDFSAGVYLAPIELPQGGTVKVAAFDGPKRVGPVTTKVVPNPGSDIFNPAETPVTQNRDHRTYDWVERHNAILELNKPGASAAQVVLIGDSITHFWGGEPKSTRVAGAASWERFIAPHKPINLGFGWDRTENVLWRLQHGELKGINPRVVVLAIGTNNLGLNTVDEVVDGIDAICQEVHRQLPKTKILVLGILPRADSNRLKANPDSVNFKLQTRLHPRDYIDVFDAGNAFLTPSGELRRELFSDGLHPNKAGYEILANAIAPHVARMKGT